MTNEPSKKIEDFDKKIEALFKASEIFMKKMRTLTFLWAVFVSIGAAFSILNFCLLHYYVTHR